MTTNALPLVLRASLMRLLARALSRGESLLRSWTDQCPQRHQGSDGDVLVIHQLFLRERQRFHNGWCLVLGLRLDQEGDAFSIAAQNHWRILPSRYSFTVARISDGITSMICRGVTPCLGV